MERNNLELKKRQQSKKSGDPPESSIYLMLLEHTACQNSSQEYPQECCSAPPITNGSISAKISLAHFQQPLQLDTKSSKSSEPRYSVSRYRSANRTHLRKPIELKTRKQVLEQIDAVLGAVQSFPWHFTSICF